jgi:hypothetical protein
MTTLALRVQEFVLSRIKQVKINNAGALVLMQDVEIIFACFQGLDGPEVKGALDEVGWSGVLASA